MCWASRLSPFADVSVTLRSQSPPKTAPKSDTRFAIRKATEALTGRNGVAYASVAARQARALNGDRWEGCGLVREHAIPVGHICQQVVGALETKRTGASLARARQRLDAEMTKLPVKAGDFDGFPDDPHIAFVAAVIRASTVMAWLTTKEDDLLKAKLGDGSESLNKLMPPGWDGVDPLARYRYCQIDVQPVTT